MIKVKICGLSDELALAAAVQAGADYAGFVFYARSPRYIAPERAGILLQGVPASVQSVGLIVDEDDAAIETILRHAALDMLQLHGQENPARVAEIRRRFGLPVIKAVAISDAPDVQRAKDYEGVADILLFDAKPPQNLRALPGGNGLVFDWTLLARASWTIPWMLSGGLNADNVADALRISGAKMVDVSSGVESAPGIKDVAKIRAFVKGAKQFETGKTA